MLYIGEIGRLLKNWFGKHRRAVCANDASQPVAKNFNSGRYAVSDMKLEPFVPFLVARIATKDIQCVSFQTWNFTPLRHE